VVGKSRWLVGVLVILVLSFQSGCPDSKKGEVTAPAACTERGAQCRLASGVLGVCNDIECPAGKEPPCLKCVSQH